MSSSFKISTLVLIIYCLLQYSDNLELSSFKPDHLSWELFLIINQVVYNKSNKQYLVRPTNSKLIHRPNLEQNIHVLQPLLVAANTDGKNNSKENKPTLLNKPTDLHDSDKLKSKIEKIDLLKKGFEAKYPSLYECIKSARKHREFHRTFLSWKREILNNKKTSKEAIDIISKMEWLSEEYPKEMLRGEYKSGIYLIKNIITKKFYVGKSSDLFNRFKQYDSPAQLKRNKTSLINRKILKFGYSKFIFYVIEFCPSSKLNAREQFYIQNLKPQYNIRKSVHKEKIEQTESKPHKGQI